MIIACPERLPDSVQVLVAQYETEKSCQFTGAIASGTQILLTFQSETQDFDLWCDVLGRRLTRDQIGGLEPERVTPREPSAFANLKFDREKEKNSPPYRLLRQTPPGQPTVPDLLRRGDLFIRSDRDYELCYAVRFEQQEYFQYQFAVRGVEWNPFQQSVSGWFIHYVLAWTESSIERVRTTEQVLNPQLNYDHLIWGHPINRPNRYGEFKTRSKVGPVVAVDGEIRAMTTFLDSTQRWMDDVEIIRLMPSSYPLQVNLWDLDLPAIDTGQYQAIIREFRLASEPCAEQIDLFDLPDLWSA